MALGLADQAQDLTHRAIPRKWVEPLLRDDLPALQLPDYVTSSLLEKARGQVFAGRYKDALLTLQKIPHGDPIEIALIKTAALEPLGRWDEALAILSDQSVKDDSRVQINRARILSEMGRDRQAVALLGQVVQAHADSIDGHYWLGHISEKIGDLDGARQAYAFFEPFIDKWQGDPHQFSSAADVTTIGRGLDRWATLNSAYPTHRPLHDIILGMFLKAYDEIDRSYWPAHVAAAEYYAAHDDQESAVKELDQAADGNPQDIESLTLMGRIALQSYNFDAADAAIEGIRNIDPNSIAGNMLLTRALLQQRLPSDAQAAVKRVLAAQPSNIEALGLLAATEALQLHDDQTAAVLKQVDKLDPHNASAYLDVAEQLGAMRQYPRAAAMYKIAVDRAPWWTTARNGLGLLYTQSGEENDALTVLNAAHELDPFNYATTNYLRLLDELMKFSRKETAHFVVFYDAQTDPVIPEYFGDYLESIYPSVTGEYHQEPPVKTYIEVFPTHDAFSVRTTGSPWIGTVGASTGRVIAMVAPRKGHATMGPFNWSQVLRHEFTHTVTLAATDNRIAHWFTEGLAVLQEHSPLRWEWIPMLYQAVNKDQLFTLDHLTWAFIRPKRPIDRQLAYAESYWICQYIEENWGHQTILKMLAEFRQGKEQPDVFLEVLGKSESEFEKGFFAWTHKQVAGWGYDADSSKRYDELREQGEALIHSRDYQKAVEVWKQIETLRPVDQLPHSRLAGLYIRLNQPQNLVDELIQLHLRSLHDNIYAKKISRVYRDMGQTDKATAYALQAVYIDPYDPDAHELLADLDAKTGNTDGAAKEKRVLKILDAMSSDENTPVN